MFSVVDWNIEAMTGYKPISTFYTDFSIADRFGVSAIRDTYNRAFEGWKNDYKMLTELAMVVNWKVMEHHNAGHKSYAGLYSELWAEVDHWACENLKGEELSYYDRTID